VILGSMAKLRAEEVAARGIVALAMPDTTVTHHDDGRSPRMVDLHITYPDGRIAGLEVVTDTDQGYRQTRVRLLEHGQVIDAPDLRFTWQVIVADGAKIREIRERMPWLLALMEDLPPSSDLGWPRGRRWHDHVWFADAFEQLGVTEVRPVSEIGSSEVILSTRTLGGREGTPNLIPGWVGDFLADTADVPAKLAEGGYPERHAFVWATWTTEYHVLSAISGTGLPTDPPDLPDALTHVWVGSYESGGRVIRWEPDNGWSQVFRIPQYGPIEPTH
jgi:hypothetical protein